MMTGRSFGFEEIPHTADWALRVWAPDLPTLFTQAAEGMYWLMETTFQAGSRVERVIDLEAGDTESLLVAFLSELLYACESEGLGFDRFEINVGETNLRALAHGAALAGQKKEIKAVTYHNLAIQHSDQGFSVTIVFDV